MLSLEEGQKAITGSAGGRKEENRDHTMGVGREGEGAQDAASRRGEEERRIYFSTHTVWEWTKGKVANFIPKGGTVMACSKLGWRGRLVKNWGKKQEYFLLQVKGGVTRLEG